MNRFSFRPSRYLMQRLAIFTVAVLFVSSSFAQDGEKLFQNNCASCHTAGTNKLVGPGLQGITEKRDQEWLIDWIKNSQAMIDAGDPQAVKIFEEYNKVIMPPQPLSEEEILAVLDYIETAEKQQQADAAAAGTDGAAATAEAKDEPTPPWVYVLVILILLGLISLLRNISFSLRKVVAERDGKEPPKDTSMFEGFFKWIKANNKFVAIIIIVLVVLGAKDVWDTLWQVGVYEGYKPEQPIAFSHKLHAGQNDIDCQYCHSSARNGRTSMIPSPNVCMNCHKAVQKGPKHGEKEIKKIYAALDYDPGTGKYGDNPQPIQWIKVHNLPDHVYFNHSQHVSVAKLECQTCHGPVEEMEVLEQHSPLTMGWCIDCHKSSAVKMDGNGYYEEMHKNMPEKYKEQFMEDGTITVDELGGIECAKCHY